MKNEKRLFYPPAPKLKEQVGNVYKPLFYDFTDVKQVHVSEKPSLNAIRHYNLENLLQYKILHNDHTDMSLIYLNAAKNLICQCLTNMPAHYITHVVFNEKHITFTAFIKNSPKVASCVTFRIFDKTKLCELVFCVVKSDIQVSGIGTNLMEHFKQYLQVLGVRNVLVYADNSAIGFFEKQGFSQKIGVQQKYYKGIIKHYDGATLMHLEVDPYYDYVHHQDFTESMQKIIAANLENPQIIQFKKFPVPQILGINIDQKTTTSIKDPIQMIYEQTISHSSSNLFKTLISKKDFPDYYQTVKRPMCFETIERKIQAGKYNKIAELISDMELIISNVF